MLQRASAYRRSISAKGAYPLLTLGHLAQESESEWGYLRAIVERRVSEYLDIQRRKRDGSLRHLSAPKPSLMHIQRWILANVLTGLDLHPSAFAYRFGISVKDCAEQHIGARWLLKMDLHNFFGAIGESRVYRQLRNIGYPALLAFEMARICTRVVPPSTNRDWLEGRGVEPYGFPYPGTLPQGAPTSGALANAVAFRLDERLTDIAERSSLVYTRYSDDLTFSSPSPFNRASVPRLIAEVEGAITLERFAAHRRKTRLIPPGARKVVLGLMLTDNAVRLLPEFRDRLDNHIRCVTKYGPGSHATKRRFDSTLSMINHVDGCLSFALHVERDWARERMHRWAEALAGHGHPVHRDP